jgi:hypothetical protein
MSQPDVDRETHPASGKDKNRIELTVRHAGFRVTLDFNPHQKIQKVIDEALKAFAEQFNIQPPANATPVLRFGDRDLDPNQSILEAGIPDESELDLRFNPRAG